MRVIVCYLLFSFLLVNQLHSQSKKANHSAGLEVGKLGLLLNLMYDCQFEKTKVGIRAIAGKNFERYLNVYQAGAGAYYLLGNKKNHLETGLDFFYFYADEVSDDQMRFINPFPVRNASTLYTSGNVGYRHSGAKTIFRIGISQGYMHALKNYYTGGYLSFAIRFNP